VTALAPKVMPAAVSAADDPSTVGTTLAVPFTFYIILMVISCDFEVLLM
jgi:hypothetical protein